MIFDGIFQAIAQAFEFARQVVQDRHTPIAEAKREEAETQAKKEQIAEDVKPDADISEIQRDSRFPD